MDQTYLISGELLQAIYNNLLQQQAAVTRGMLNEIDKVIEQAQQSRQAEARQKLEQTIRNEIEGQKPKAEGTAQPPLPTIPGEPNGA